MKVLILFTLFTLSTATVYLKTDDFESMLDYEGIDLENPFDEEE